MKRKLLTLSLALIMVVAIFAGCMGAVEFDVKFVSDGEVIHTISTTGNETIKMPQNPTKEGYTFDGWYWDKDTWQRPFTASSLLNEPLSGDMSVYAKWVLADLSNESFEVSFNTMGGSDVNGQIVKYGGLVTEPAEPSRSGYIFAGWYKDADLQNKWSFTTDMVSGKTTIYAKWVSASDNEGAEILSAEGFVFDGNILKMTVPYSQDKVAISALIKVSPYASYMVSKDIEGINQIPTGTVTLEEGKNVFYILVTSGTGSNKSQYIVEITRESAPICNVTLELNGGRLEDGEEASFALEWGKAIESLPSPTQKGYRFDGWALNGEIISLPYTPSAHITLSAVWTEASTVYFNVNGGKLPQGASSSVMIEKGEAIGELPVPTRYGYSFSGWYVNYFGYHKISQTFIVEEDTELLAMWESLGEIVTVEFLLGIDETLIGGEAFFFEIIEGERISAALDALPTASKPNFKFVGWQDENGTRVTITTKVTKDMVLTPIWENIVYCLDGTESHQWNAWQTESEPTCTEAGRMARVCGVCGHMEYKIYAEANGHSYSESSVDFVGGTVCVKSECMKCGEAFVKPYQNITVDSFEIPELNGTCYSSLANAGSLVDGVIPDSVYGTVCPTGATAFTVTLNAKDATYVDVFAVTGRGSSAYTVSVTYKDGSVSDLGIGSFGQGGTTKMFVVEAEVVKIEVNMPHPSNGMDYFLELGAYVKGDGEYAEHYFVETVSISNTGVATLIRDCAYCGLVERKELNNITYANFDIPIIDGIGFGFDRGADLIDGDFFDKQVAGSPDGPVTVTLTAKQATYIDIFTVTGCGTESYNVEVTYSDDTVKDFGFGSFGDNGYTKEFFIEGTVTKIEIHMENPNYGFWQELGAFIIK